MCGILLPRRITPSVRGRNSSRTRARALVPRRFLPKVNSKTHSHREKAKQPLDPKEHEQIGSVCDGELMVIVIELDVTLQINEDYREMVLAPMQDQCAAL